MGFQKDQGHFTVSSLIARHVAVSSNVFTEDKIGFTQDCKTYKMYVCCKPRTGGCSHASWATISLQLITKRVRVNAFSALCHNDMKSLGHFLMPFDSNNNNNKRHSINECGKRDGTSSLLLSPA